MGDIYGVASPIPPPALYDNTADVTCTAGSEVIAITTTTAVTAYDAQNYVALVSGVAIFLMGATASAALQLAIRYHLGSDIQTQAVAAGLLANNATIVVPFSFVTAVSADWVGGHIIELTTAATTTACTFKYVGSTMMVELVRAN